MSVNEQTGEFDVLPAISQSALEAQTRGEIDIQVSTAKRYPRSITAFKKEIESLALLDQQTAEACIYALPRDGKSIEGPSARFAEIAASCWGHMRIETRVSAEDDHFISVRGVAWDLERNLAKAVEVRRRITKKSGQKFNDDMIVVTSNAAGSIASRNAVLQVIPRAYWFPVYEACRKAAVGDQKTLANRRAGALAHFQKMGITADRIFALLGVAGVDDINGDHVLQLLGLATAIKEGDTNIDDAFGSAAAGAGPGRVVPMPAKTDGPHATARKVEDEQHAATTQQTVAPSPAADPELEWHHVNGVVDRKSSSGKAYFLITTREGLKGHTWSTTVAADAREEMAAGAVVRFEGASSTFTDAPFKITKLIRAERELGAEG